MMNVNSSVVTVGNNGKLNTRSTFLDAMNRVFPDSKEHRYNSFMFDEDKPEYTVADTVELEISLDDINENVK